LALKSGVANNGVGKGGGRKMSSKFWRWDKGREEKGSGGKGKRFPVLKRGGIKSIPPVIKNFIFNKQRRDPGTVGNRNVRESRRSLPVGVFCF